MTEDKVQEGLDHLHDAYARLDEAGIKCGVMYIHGSNRGSWALVFEKRIDFDKDRGVFFFRESADGSAS